MPKPNKLLVTILVCVALVLGDVPVFAMNTGDASSLVDIQTKLANESQVEIATGATRATGKPLRGISFYYNKTSGVGYVVLTNDPIRPTQARILFKTIKNNLDGINRFW